MIMKFHVWFSVVFAADVWRGLFGGLLSQETGSNNTELFTVNLMVIRGTSLKTLTSLNKEVRPFFLSDNSIWSYPSVSSLSDYSIWRS